MAPRRRGRLDLRRAGHINLPRDTIGVLTHPARLRGSAGASPSRTPNPELRSPEPRREARPAE